jgi:hypothetical protein
VASAEVVADAASLTFQWYSDMSRSACVRKAAGWAARAREYRQTRRHRGGACRNRRISHCYPAYVCAAVRRVGRLLHSGNASAAKCNFAVDLPSTFVYAAAYAARQAQSTHLIERSAAYADACPVPAFHQIERRRDVPARSLRAPGLQAAAQGRMHMLLQRAACVLMTGIMARTAAHLWLSVHMHYGNMQRASASGPCFHTVQGRAPPHVRVIAAVWSTRALVAAGKQLAIVSAISRGADADVRDGFGREAYSQGRFEGPRGWRLSHN